MPQHRPPLPPELRGYNDAYRDAVEAAAATGADLKVSLGEGSGSREDDVNWLWVPVPLDMPLSEARQQIAKALRQAAVDRVGKRDPKLWTLAQLIELPPQYPGPAGDIMAEVSSLPERTARLRRAVGAIGSKAAAADREDARRRGLAADPNLGPVSREEVDNGQPAGIL